MADAHRFSSGGLVRIGDVEQFATVVTDDTLSEPIVQAAERAGVEVVRAGPASRYSACGQGLFAAPCGWYGPWVRCDSCDLCGGGGDSPCQSS